MPTPIIPPRLTSILREASSIAPHRRVSSDGTIGDLAHRQEKSDHNPDPVTGIVHAVDVSESMPGTPYWNPMFDEFDVWAYAWKIVGQYQAATPAVRAQRWPWLFDGGYMVWFDTHRGVDVIYDPAVSPVVRQNGAAKQDHNQHCHFSIGHTTRSEQDTQPIFSNPVPEEEMTDAEREAFRAEIKSDTVAVVRKVLADDLTALVEAAIQKQFGGYSPGGQYVDGLLITAARKQYGLSKP